MRVQMLTSWQERCGIAEYSRDLAQALPHTAGIEKLAIVPANFQRPPRSTYRAMGLALSCGDVAHVQHSYAFFGGMHPLRSGWPAVLEAVTSPLLVTVHELDAGANDTGVRGALLRWYKRQFNRHCFGHRAIGGWMVHAEGLRQELLALGIPERRITYRPIPVPEPPAVLADPAPLRHELRLGGKRVLVILGFLARRKGYEVALAALRQLPPDVVLVAAGGEHAADRTGTEAWLRALAGEMGLADRVRITGYLSPERLEAATALADVVLAPFTQMSASASMSYSLARGKAVIASDLGENRRLPCVRLVPPGDAPALSHAIGEVIEWPSERRRLENAALAYAAENSFESLATCTRDLYAQLIKEQLIEERAGKR